MISAFNNEFRFLSNFYLCEVEYLGIKFNSSEHAYQYAKCKLDTDKEKILASKTPGQAKRIGARVKLIDNWDQSRLDTMYKILKVKFSQNLRLKDKLIATGSQELIEGNYWGDRFWGVCDGTGQNHLGKILMKIRKELR